MKVKTLMVDMDNVITDGRFLDYIKEFLNENLQDVDNDNIGTFFIDKNEEFWDWVKDKDFYDNSPLLDGCYEVLKELNDKYDVYIATGYLYDENIDISGFHLMNKYYYLKKKLDFIDQSKYIFISNKELLHADVMIDDKAENLVNAEVKILFLRDNINSAFDDSVYVKANNWEDIKNILL